MRKLILLFIILLINPKIYALEADNPLNQNKVEDKGITNSLSVDAEAAYVFSSIVDEIREPMEIPVVARSHFATSFFLKWLFNFRNPHIRNYYPEGYQGIGTGLMLFGNGHDAPRPSRSYIGSPVMAYLFQGGPVKHLSSNLSLNYEWQFGASFGWKPWNRENAGFNLTVGSRVNAYMNLRLFLSWKISQRWRLEGGLSVSHFSNGNTSWPNPGINMTGLRLGVAYDLSPDIAPAPDALPDSVRRGHLSYDIILWGSSRKRVYKGGEAPVLLNGHFACAGIGFAPMAHMGRWWRLGGSADIQWDESSDLKKNYISGTTPEDIRFHRPDFLRQVSFGISAHVELTMPVFSVNLGIGYNLYAPRENRGTYQNITLKTYLGKVFFINIGYQLRNFHQQSSLMLGAGVTV